MGFSNDTEIWVYHLKRGGGHAVITWILRASGRPAMHLNNVFSKPWKARWRAQRVFRPRPLWYRGEGSVKLRLSGVELDPSAGWREVARMPRDLLVLNVENFPLERVPREPLHGAGAERILGPSRRRITVLVLRDAPNTFASVVRGKRRMRARLGGFYRRHWKSYAREFLGETAFLPPDTVKVSYNAWFADPEYRRGIAARLGLADPDAGLDEVSAEGGGSSFEGTSADGRGRGMAVLERWRRVAEDPAWRAALDAETVELSTRIFGDVTGGLLGTPGG